MFHVPINSVLFIFLKTKKDMDFFSLVITPKYVRKYRVLDRGHSKFAKENNTKNYYEGTKEYISRSYLN